VALVRLASGVELELHPPGDYVSDAIRRTGEHYEQAILEELRERLHMAPRGVIVDGGAHLGNHSTYLARALPWQVVHAFEPVPSSFALLCRNAVPYDNLVPHSLALSDRPGLLTMTLEPNLGHSRADEDGGIVAQAATLDELELEFVVLLKLDVEGHEPQALAGARRTLERWRPLVLIEDWGRAYGPLLPGYRVVAEWELAHQTYLYEFVGG
jgi:FkbM family methyltransferase